jgi:NAD(P)-dependent dehydrogenase (short-subunit alcohol dehydrogenase family)
VLESSAQDLQQQLDGKVAIVTGAGSPRGTGHAMALSLARAGARVAMLDVNTEWLGESVADVEGKVGRGRVKAVVADVSDRGDISRAVAEVIDAFGGVHILINNAGTNPRALGFQSTTRKFWEPSLDVWDKVVAVNMNGPYYAIRAVIEPMLRQRWGRIIGVTTSLDTMYGVGKVPYGPSKAGHEALIAAMSRELDGTGVTANIVVPGGPANTNFFSDKDKTPAQRAALIQPEVMGPPAVWLASDASADFNGRRIISCHWDERAPLAERLAKATAPAAWPQLGRQAVMPRKDVSPE